MADRRVVITRDGDFGPIVAASGRREPSVIQFRTSDGRPSAEASLLIGLLPQLEPDLLAGASVVVEDDVVRIMPLK